MYKYVLAGCLALLLCACHPSGSSADKAPAMASSSAVAAGNAASAEDHPDEITPPRSAAELSADMLDRVLSSPARSKADKALDDVRHPRRTLVFFGLRPDMNVIEVDPDGGWYAAILAPLLKDDGTCTVALISPMASKHAAQTMQTLRQMFLAHPDLYGRARLASFDPRTPNLGTPGSADMVLSFRGVHAWVTRGTAKAMFRAVYDVLQPGGVFGVVDNRASDDTEADDLVGTPYVRQADVVKLAEQAGFKLDAASNINANPGESGIDDKAPDDADRMTLRFVKPAKPAHEASS
ncbi:MAG TPA: methyltransferase [Rhodanobacteraceae bacterium]|nr:methyltransferase [Rhodanobacteraceae bacterium]